MAKIVRYAHVYVYACAHLTLRYKKSFGFLYTNPEGFVLRYVEEPGGSRRLTTVRYEEKRRYVTEGSYGPLGQPPLGVEKKKKKKKKDCVEG